MTPSELKQHVSLRQPHFFSHKTMRFFGDTMRNYGVRSNGDCWELYRKKPVRGGLRTSHFFDKTTFISVYPQALVTKENAE